MTTTLRLLHAAGFCVELRLLLVVTEHFVLVVVVLRAVAELLPALVARERHEAESVAVE